MNRLICGLIISIFLLDYLGIEIAVIPREFTWIPELISLFAIVMVALSMGNKNVALDRKYLIFFIVFLVHIFLGIVMNAVPEGAVISGLRTYLKFMPIFLIPVVYKFSEKQIKFQINLLIFLLIIQMPLALYQRLVQFKGHLSGDPISGTLNISSMLTVAMVSAMTIVMAFYLKKRITPKKALFLIAIFFIPITLNETKSSLILFPLALITPVFLLKGARKKFQTTLITSVIIGVGLIAFVGVYDHFMQPRWGYGLTDFLTMEGRLEKYLYRGVEADKKFEHMGKMDSYMLAFSVLSDDFFKLLLGLGAGNVSGSFIGGLGGEYTQYISLGAGTTSLAFLLWELGILGVFIHLVFFYMIFQDSRKLSRSNSYLGALALGFASVMIIITVCLGYKNFLYTNVMGYMLWYFAGLISSTNMRMKREHNRHVLQNRNNAP